jgi:small subunit ribosomal protein S16
MVKIRLARGGRKKRPFFFVVVADSRCPRDGRFIERVGHYDPLKTTEGCKAVINMDRVKYWLSKGAKVTERVVVLLKQLDDTVKASVA